MFDTLAVNGANPRVTRVEKVTGAVRKEEIARMLAGDRKGELSLQHAGELLVKYGPGRDEG